MTTHRQNNLFDFHAAMRLVEALTAKNHDVNDYPRVKQLIISESQAQELAIKYPITISAIRNTFTVIDDVDFYPKEGTL
ncbi:hypothetical protein P7F88_25125 [Vibrio hannami]|uniref:hypothetical protein n=1 Tax=Vibrio hannami TaxID=2717094 RepID=UPI00240F19B0|nr:hypothetical protein [Vibrio hannami]MDG3089147.1 hypothetical protein [Vibrio hannami]